MFRANTKGAQKDGRERERKTDGGRRGESSLSRTVSKGNTGLPAAHVEHVAADADVDPAGPYLPAAQAVPEQVHDELAPVTAEYLPANRSPLSAHLPRTRAYPAPRMWRHAGGRALVSSLYQGNATAN